MFSKATSKSLLIIDELGRGTSTTDGYAIAWAVLHQLVDIGALCLFATHYHGLTSDFEWNKSVSLNHMGYMKAEDDRSVVFLYQFKTGAAGNSYGLNVAQMAGIFPTVIDNASRIIDQAKQAGRFSTDTRIQTVVDLARCGDNDEELRNVLEETGYWKGDFKRLKREH